MARACFSLDSQNPIKAVQKILHKALWEADFWVPRIHTLWMIIQSNMQDYDEL